MNNNNIQEVNGKAVRFYNIKVTYGKKARLFNDYEAASDFVKFLRSFCKKNPMLSANYVKLNGLP